MAEIAWQALSAGPSAAPLDLTFDEGPVAADVWIEGNLGFVLLLHRRDDGLVAEEVYYSVRGQEEGKSVDWLDCDHLGGGVLGFHPADASARREILAGHPMAILTESESLIHTGRVLVDEGDELVRIVELLVTDEADVLEVENPAGSAPQLHRTASGLVLLVLLPGDRIRARAADLRGSHLVPIGEAIELTHS